MKNTASRVADDSADDRLETEYLLRSPANARRIFRAFREVEASDGTSRSIAKSRGTIANDIISAYNTST